MAGYLNKVTLIGNLGSDPEVRATSAGKKIVTISLATSESWRDARSNERVERTEWHRIVIFAEGLATIAEKYLTCGSKVYIEGKLATNKWQDRDGNDRYTTEIQLQPYSGTLTMLDSKSRSDERADSRASGAETRKREPAMAGAGKPSWEPTKGGDLDDDIPF